MSGGWLLLIVIVFWVAMVAANLYITRQDALKGAYKNGTEAGIKWLVHNATVYTRRCSQCHGDVEAQPDVESHDEEDEAISRARRMLNGEDG